MGDKVRLSMKDLLMKGRCRKLEARRLVEQINLVLFKLELPTLMKLYPLFHRVYLSPYIPAHQYQEPKWAPPSVMVEDKEEFEIQQILDLRWYRRLLLYVVSYKGYGPEENSWVCSQDLHPPDLHRQFHRRYPHKPRARGWGGRGGP